MARPKKQVDEKVVVEAAGLMCTDEEIATLVGMCVDTLVNRFSELLEKGRAKAKESLRRTQWKLANEGNPTMCIWLGKQYLGQTDKAEARIDVSQGIQILEDTNWYGNADRFAALAAGPSTPGAAIAGPVQSSAVRKALGKNGDGTAGNGEGPRDT